MTVDSEVKLVIPAKAGIQYCRRRGEDLSRLYSRQCAERYFVHWLTGSLVHRIDQHRNGTADGFTKRYRVTMLVYAEAFADVHEAIVREKAIKKWRRAWKLELIEQSNPDWRDLYDDLI